MTEQLTLQLEPALAVRHPSLKACIASGVYQRGVTTVAGKIDRAPSHVCEALSGTDRRKFDVDDLERYIAATGDTDPILYLVAKYLRDPAAAQQEAMARVAVLGEQIAQLMVQSGLSKPRRGR